MGQRLPRPDAGQPLQRRLLAAGHRARRAAAAPHPQRDDGRGHGRRGLQGRVQLRPARDQLPLRRRAAGRRRARRSTRTAPRRSPPRTARRSPSWRSSTSARATRATSTSRCAAPTARSSSTTTSGLFDRFLAGMLAGLRELTLFLAPNINSYKRYAARLLRARRRSPGATTTAPARCASSATAPAGASSAASPGADVNPYLALSALIAAGLHGVDAELELEPALEGNAYEADRAPAGARDAARRPRPVRGERDRARRLRRGGRRRTTSTTRASSSRPSTRPSPTGSASGASSGCRRRLGLARADPAAGRAGSRSPSASRRAPGGPSPRRSPCSPCRPHTGHRLYPSSVRRAPYTSIGPTADRHFGPPVVAGSDRSAG